MGEELTEVRAFWIKYLCDACGTPVENTGETLLSCPPEFRHRCPKCEKVHDLRHSYPRIGYKEIDN